MTRKSKQEPHRKDQRHDDVFTGRALEIMKTRRRTESYKQRQGISLAKMETARELGAGGQAGVDFT